MKVWAPAARSLALRLGGRDIPLDGEEYYETPAPPPDEDYWLVVDGEPLPDPGSQWQPRGLRGPSRVLEFDQAPAEFDGPSLAELVIYELHVGTFTPAGTFDEAAARLDDLAALGVTAVELMPVAEFPGSRGWGYDGVYISAAQSSYGGPFALRAFVDAAHAAGLAVILDVVYNHVGASGVRALEAFGPYFTDEYETFWGRAINFGCEAVRNWVVESAVGWIRDFGIDGLRLDAIHAIFDPSPHHIVAAIARDVHEVNPRALVIGEVGMEAPSEHGAPACDAIWVDDFHHALHVLLTGERDGYYKPFGRVEQLAEAFRHAPPERFVVYAQNHDQVGNRALGDRLPVAARPLAAFCTLLSPFVPLLFMGEEYGETAPFQFFSDHIDPEIARATREGRRHEFAAFAQFGDEVPDPQARETFKRSKLGRVRDPVLGTLYEELLRLRRELPGGEPTGIDFDEDARVLRVRRERFELVCNFGSEALRLPCGGDCIRLATSADTALNPPHLQIAPLSGALIT